MPVHGAVTLDGKPLSGADIMFVPVGDTQGTGASGFTDKEGKYEVRDRRGDKGVPAGQYHVSIQKNGLLGGLTVRHDSKGPPASLPPGPPISNEKPWILKATVPDGGGTLDFPLKSNP
jgi:hypothetical protein